MKMNMQLHVSDKFSIVEPGEVILYQGRAFVKFANSIQCFNSSEVDRAPHAAANAVQIETGDLYCFGGKVYVERVESISITTKVRQE